MTSLNKAQPHLIPITYMDGLTLAQRHHCNSDVGQAMCAILDEAQNGLPITLLLTTLASMTVPAGKHQTCRDTLMS